VCKTSSEMDVLQTNCLGAQVSLPKSRFSLSQLNLNDDNYGLWMPCSPVRWAVERRAAGVRVGTLEPVMAIKTDSSQETIPAKPGGTE